MLNNSEPVSAFAYYSQFKQQNGLENKNKRKNNHRNSPQRKKPKVNNQKPEKKVENKVRNVPKPAKPPKTVEVIKQKPVKELKTEESSKTIEPRKQKTVKQTKKIVKIKEIPRKSPKIQKSSSGYFHIDNFNSIKSGERLLKWIMHPVKVNQFFKENWEKQPIIVQRNSPNYYSDLLSCEDIDKALRKQMIYFTKNIDVTSYSDGKRETHNPSGRATAPLVWDFYSIGCSIRILNPQTFFPKIHALNAALQEYFECFVGANVYLTPADSQGFAPHYDDIEAFVIQIEGEKLWKLYAPRNKYEVLPRLSSGNFSESDLGPPIQEVLLKAGDLMYFPRGYIHQGVALKDKHSLHITLSAYQKNSWADLLETLIPAALNSAIEEDVSFRQGLPLHTLSHMGLVHSDKNNTFRDNFMNKIKHLMTKLVDYAPIDAAVDQLGKKYIHDCLPPFLKSDEKDFTVFGDGETIQNGVVSNQAEMCLDSRIKLIRYNCIRMLHEEDKIRIYYSISNSKEYHAEEPQFLEIDEELAPAVDALISSYPAFIEVNQLPINDDIAKVQIASDLWESGIIQTEDSLSYLSD